MQRPFDPDDEEFEGYEGDDEDDRFQFAEPHSNSALIAASRSNPRNLPCPTCGTPDVLTPADRARGYQCNACAMRAEGYDY